MQSSAIVTEIQMPSKLIDALDALPDQHMGTPPQVWTPEMDEALLYGWERKGHAVTAKVLGLHAKTCLKRWRKLTEET